MAYGGNFYAIADAAAVGLRVALENAPALISAGLELMSAVPEPVHPENSAIRGCHHVIWTDEPSSGADGRAATAIYPGWVDRSPCGTGTSARMAQRYARGRLALGAPFVHESIIGTRFTGRLVGETEIGGRPAVIPEITGRAWITGHGVLHARRVRPVPERLSRWLTSSSSARASAERRPPTSSPSAGSR